MSLTSVADGYWDDPLTWATTPGVTPPGSGDKAIIATNVTVRRNTIIGDGTATTVLTCTSDTASLTIIGATLTIRGNAVIGYQSGSGIVHTFVTVQPDAETGLIKGGIEFDGNSGVAPSMSIERDSQILFAGTAQAHTFIRMRSGTSGSPATISTAAPSYARSFLGSFTYCDFIGLGDQNNDALYSPNPGYQSEYEHPVWLMDHCEFTECGTIQLGTREGTDLKILDSVFHALTANPDTNVLRLGCSESVAGGNCLVQGCVFYSWVNFFPVSGLRCYDCYFDHGWGCSGYGSGHTTYEGIFNVQRYDYEQSTYGNVYYSYYLNYPLSGEQRMFGFGTGGMANKFAHHIVCQNTSNMVAGGCFWGGEGGINNRFCRQSNNILLPTPGPNPNGQGAGGGSPGFINPPYQQWYWGWNIVEHCTTNVGWAPFTRGYGTTGLSGLSRSNIAWSASPITPPDPPVNEKDAAYAYVADTFWPGFGQPAFSPFDPRSVDQIYPSRLDYNAHMNVLTVPAETWTAPNDYGNGTHYNGQFSAAPGVHDIELTSAPFVDPYVNVQTWDQWLDDNGDPSPGTAGTIDSALLRLQRDPYLTKRSLIPYIFANYELSPGSSCIGAAHDGGNIGAV